MLLTVANNGLLPQLRRFTTLLGSFCSWITLNLPGYFHWICWRDVARAKGGLTRFWGSSICFPWWRLQVSVLMGKHSLWFTPLELEEKWRHSQLFANKLHPVSLCSYSDVASRAEVLQPLVCFRFSVTWGSWKCESLRTLNVQTEL